MQGYRRRLGKVLGGVLIAAAFSCGAERRSASFNPAPPEPVQTGVRTTPGSLYTGNDNLFSDAKAYQVGDILTVKVVEDIKGSGSATGKLNRKTSFDVNINRPKVLGKERPQGSGKDPLLGFSTSPSSSFSGAGSTTRNAKLIATISARVVKVYPNGNLFIVGKKVIKINDDVQVLRISGIVKPTDIGTDNSVLSSKVADMYVEYNGKGYFADNQRPGWLARLLLKLLPF